MNRVFASRFDCVCLANLTTRNAKITGALRRGKGELLMDNGRRYQTPDPVGRAEIGVVQVSGVNKQQSSTLKYLNYTKINIFLSIIFVNTQSVLYMKMNSSRNDKIQVQILLSLQCRTPAKPAKTSGHQHGGPMAVQTATRHPGLASNQPCTNRSIRLGDSNPAGIVMNIV